jgi:hypothetical protein
LVLGSLIKEQTVRRLQLLVALIVVALVVPATAGAQERTRCFSETGYCVSGKILAYWEQNGGLPIFGYPIGDLHEEAVEPGPNSWSGPVQWFQRDRLEDHSNQGLGVLAGRLGALQYESLTVGLIVPRQDPVSGPAPGCRFFPETGHNMCGPFRAYWERNGGLVRFGYPMSEPFELTSGDWRGTVQYFERRRMELHSELAGTPILLGLLGKEISQGEPSATCPIAPAGELSGWLRTIPFRNQMGCPTSTGYRGPAAEQYFQYGVMLWVAPPPGERIGRIYVVGTGLPIMFQVFADTWQEGMGDPPDQAPAGLLTPKRGFGKVWSENPDIRQKLGWAAQPERADEAYVSDFTSGAVVWLTQTDFVYAFGPNQIAQAKPRSWGQP